MNIRKIISHFDFLILLLVAPLVLLSLFLINELDAQMFDKEVKYIALSVLVCAGVFFIPFRKSQYLIYAVYALLFVLLILVKYIGVSKNFAQRWIEIPFTSFSIQPSELMKIALMLLLASYISKKPPPKDGYGWLDFGIISAFILLPFFAVLLEPDLGTALIILLTGFGTIFLVGISKRILVTLGVGFGVLLIPLIIGTSFLYSSGALKGYHQKRINDFISGNYPYQVQQSLIAIGSGGLTGNEKDMATQSQLNFLPYASTDFIFAYFVERFGLVGAVALVGLYALIVAYLLSIAANSVEDFYLRVVSGYIAILFFLYAGVNMCMVMGLAPVVGIPLPMISYGGTSFMTFMILLGIFENALAFRFIFDYNSAFQAKGGPLAQLVRALGS